MQTFEIIISKNITETYLVEAENQNDAIERVMHREVDPDNIDIDDNIGLLSVDKVPRHIVTAFKLMRKKDNTFHSLFINRNVGYKIGKWLKAQCYPSKKFAVREGWHCCYRPIAPHLKMKLANGEERVWVKVEVKKWEICKRPESQGGNWIIAKQMKILGELT